VKQRDEKKMLGDEYGKPKDIIKFSLLELLRRIDKAAKETGDSIILVLDFLGREKEIEFHTLPTERFLEGLPDSLELGEIPNAINANLDMKLGVPVLVPCPNGDNSGYFAIINPQDGQHRNIIQSENLDQSVIATIKESKFAVYRDSKNRFFLKF
jgi:hypothetical protein